MARGVNKVILIGNLGQDPEVRFMPSGSPVANLRVATTDTWTDKQSGQRQERTEWHSVVLFNRLAGDRSTVPEEGLSSLSRRAAADAQVAGAGRPGPLHYRDCLQ